MNLPFRFMVKVVSGWVNRHQQDIIDYLCEEKAILIEKLGGRPQPFTNSKRIRLAFEAKKLERRALWAISPILIPDTLLRWYRRLVAKKWTFDSKRDRGRPRVDPQT